MFLTLALLMLKWTCTFSQEPELIIPVGHTELINEAVFSPDGKYIFTSSYDKTVKRWDVSTGKVMNTYVDGEYAIESVQISSDGRYFITEPASFGWKEIWDASAGKTHEIFNKQHYFYLKAMSSDGQYVLTSEKSNIIDVREFLTGNLKYSISLGEYGFNEALVSPDNKYVFISGSKHNTSVFPPESKYYSGIWNMENGSPVREFKTDSSYISHVIFCPDGKSVLTVEYIQMEAGSSQDVFSAKISDIGTGYEVWKKDSIKGIYTSASFSHDMKYVIINSNAKRILYNLTDGKIIKEQTGFTGSEQGWIITPDGKSYVRIDLWKGYYPGDDEAIYYWENKNSNKISIRDILSDSVIQTISGFENKIRWVDYSHDSKYIVTVHDDKKIKIWNSSTGEIHMQTYQVEAEHPTELKSLEGSSLGIISAAFGPDGQIISVYSDGTIKKWDIAKGKIENLKKENNLVFSIFTHDRKYLITINKKGVLNIYDVLSGSQTSSVQIEINFDNATLISPDNRYLLITSYRSSKLIEITTGRVIKDITGTLQSGSSFSSTGQFVFLAMTDSSAIIVESATGNEVKKLKGIKNIIYTSLFSPGDKYILITEADDPMEGVCKIKVVDFRTGNVKYEFKGVSGCEFQAIFSKDEKYFIGGSEAGVKKKYVSETGKIVNEIQESEYCGFPFLLIDDGKNAILPYNQVPALYNISTFEKQYELDCYESLAGYVSLSPDLKCLLTVHFDNTVKIWNAHTGELIHSLEGHSDEIKSAEYSPDGKFVLTTSLDNRIKIWDVFSGKEIASLIAVDSANWIMVTPDMYYFASRGAVKNMAWKKDNAVFGFEQFDLQYNRPDILLERLGCQDSSLIRMYRKAWDKRLKKTGFNEKMFSPEWHSPQLKILNNDILGLSSSNAKQTFKISMFDSKYKIDRLSVWVNDVPVFGINGIPLKAENNNSIVKEIPIILSDGENKVQFSCLNEKGVESLKESVNIRYNPEKKVKPQIFVILLSVSDYKDSRYNLQYAVKDGRDIASLFESKKEVFSKIYTDTLFNEKATRQNFFRLREKLMNSKEDDIVVVFTSGHGLLNNELNFYFATFDVDFSHPETNGISFDELESLLDSIPARKKLLMMDACHSGEVDKDEDILAMDMGISSDLTFRGKVKEFIFVNERESVSKSGLNSGSSFEMMQELFSGLDKGTGTTVISASAGKGYALESPEWNNGVFTYSIINGIRNMAADLNGDGEINISELKDYSVKKVIELTGGRQKPTARKEQINTDWKIW